MKSLLLFILPFVLGLRDEGRVGKTEYNILSHVLKELHHALPGEVASMQDAGFVKKLLLHVEVVTPVTRLQESGVVIKTGLDEAPQCSQYNQEEEDGPANRLDRGRKVSYTKSPKASSHVVQ